MTSPLKYLSTVNFSLLSATFSSSVKSSLISPLLKNLHLIKKTFLTTVPLPTYPLYKKITKKIVKKRLLYHLTFNALLNPFQSAYTKYYSTETTLFSLHDHLTNTIFHQQVSCLCVLALSDTFDTLNHSMVFSTWFGISELLIYLLSIIPHISCLHPTSSLSF